MKRKVLFILGAFLAVVSFTACNAGFNAPVGDEEDYIELPVDTAEEAYELKPGMGYHLKRPLPTTAYYMGSRSTSYDFKASQKVKIRYAEKLNYSTVSRLEIVDREKYEIINLSDPESNFDNTAILKENDSFRVAITVYKYNTKKSTAAEFYIWAEAAE